MRYKLYTNNIPTGILLCAGELSPRRLQESDEISMDSTKAVYDIASKSIAEKL